MLWPKAPPFLPHGLYGHRTEEHTRFHVIKGSCQHQVILAARGESPLPISTSQLSESALGIATAGGTGRAHQVHRRIV